MHTYYVRLKPLSPYLTPWRNCTIWGRLSWIVADGRLPGWDIREWLDSYRRGEPPLVIGDAFPSNAVPVPAFFHAHPQELDGGNTPKTLPWDEWMAACATGAIPKNHTGDRQVRRTERTHVVMDRAMGKSLHGGLRAEQGWQPQELILVAQVDDALGKEGLDTLMTQLCLEGWGQGRSYGYGAISLTDIHDIEAPQPTGMVVTLGHCHPDDEVPPHGYWRWAGVSVRPHNSGSRRVLMESYNDNGEERRRPVPYFTTMLLPGATFISDKKHLGRTIGMDSRPDYLHYGISPAWPIVGEDSAL